jgi:hypothetical protein
MKLSNSSINTFTTCGHSYKLKYVEKYRSLYTGSALFFGSAIDESLNYMLLNKSDKNVLKDTINVFETHWTTNIDRDGNKTSMPKNPYIKYSKYDFDTDLIEKDDWIALYAETKIYNKTNGTDIKSPLEVKNYIETQIKILSFEELSESDRSFYNYCNWIAIRNKGTILLTEYYNQLLPHISEVLDVQKNFELTDDNGDQLTGIIDFICKLKDGTVVIADNKTASFMYEEDSVRTSTQLSMYVKAINILNGDNSNYGHINSAAYFVMSKKLIKDITKICKSCGHIGEGSHKTCDNIISGELTGPGTTKDMRCNGEWEKTKKFTVETQLIVDKVSEVVQDMILENASNVKTMIENKVFIKNFNACHGKFGKCEYYEKCYSGSDKNLKKKET